MLAERARAKIGRSVSNAPPIGEALRLLAEQVERLAPSHRDPHAFHEAKSEIAHALRRLAGGYPLQGLEAKGLGPLREMKVQLVRDGNGQ